MVKSPIRHKEPIIGSSDWLYRETGIKDFGLYLWWAFCVLETLQDQSEKLMATKNQKQELYKKLQAYAKQYLKKEYKDLDESATRLMINSLLTNVFGYIELEEIKTEYRIRGEYADYIIQLKRKKQFVVEVKSIQLDLNEKHLRQSVGYAANEGVDWIILTNGKQVELYRVLFGKPISTRKIFDFDLSDAKELKNMCEMLYLLTKKSVLRDELDHFWARFEALEPIKLSGHLYSSEVVRFLRKVLKSKTGLYFGDDDILDSIQKIVSTKIESVKPKSPTSLVGKKKKPVVQLSNVVSEVSVEEDSVAETVI
ncbi:hypothetical protein GW764_00990 [Candidatus Parcubacteria bacterium]|nr:hypothetical protein [Candidatus Parcubacteria bacterium]